MLNTTENSALNSAKLVYLQAMEIPNLPGNVLIGDGDGGLDAAMEVSELSGYTDELVDDLPEDQAKQLQQLAKRKVGERQGRQPEELGAACGWRGRATKAAGEGRGFEGVGRGSELGGDRGAQPQPHPDGEMVRGLRRD